MFSIDRKSVTSLTLFGQHLTCSIWTLSVFEGIKGTITIITYLVDLVSLILFKITDIEDVMYIITLKHIKE